MPSFRLRDYLKAAFKVQYNQILFWGGIAAGAIVIPGFGPQAGLGVWTMVGAMELLYLFTLGTNPRFQAVVRAQESGAAPPAKGAPQPGPELLLSTLSAERQNRFESLRRRCADLQAALHRSGPASVGDLLENQQVESVNQLLWVFLRALAYEQGLDTFLRGMPRRELEATLKRTEEALAPGTLAERAQQAHEETAAVVRKRLENLARAEENLELVRARLLRVENSILLVQEQALTRHDPAFVEAEVSAVTAGLTSMDEMLRSLDLPQVEEASEGPIPQFVRPGMQPQGARQR